MAKRKNTRKKGRLIGLVLALAAIALAVTGIIVFLTTDVASFYIEDKTNENSVVTGLEATFGYTGELKFSGFTFKAEMLKFSFMNLLPLILLAVGAVLVLPKSKVLSIVGGLAMVVAAVLFIFVGNFVVYTEDLAKAIDTFKSAGSILGRDEIFVGFKAITNAYITCGLAGVAGLAGILKGVVSR